MLSILLFLLEKCFRKPSYGKFIKYMFKNKFEKAHVTKINKCNN